MSPADPQQFLQGMQRVESLVEEIEGSADPASRAAAQELMRTVLELHGAALAKVLALLSGAGEAGRAVLDACTRDDLLSNVLLLHGLHPQDLEARVRQALDGVRPYLRSHGGNVELVEVSAGRVLLRMEGSCHGCPSSAATLRSTIEQAIYDAAPDVTAVEVEGSVEAAGGTEQAAPPALVQIGLLSRNGGSQAAVENTTPV